MLTMIVSLRQQQQQKERKMVNGSIWLFVLVLSRVQSFLPQMQTANEQLRQQDVSKLDIENVQEDDGQYIEMVR